MFGDKMKDIDVIVNTKNHRNENPTIGVFLEMRRFELPGGAGLLQELILRETPNATSFIFGTSTRLRYFDCFRKNDLSPIARFDVDENTAYFDSPKTFDSFSYIQGGVVVLCDYSRGAITRGLCEKINSLKKDNNFIVVSSARTFIDNLSDVVILNKDEFDCLYGDSLPETGTTCIVTNKDNRIDIIRGGAICSVDVPIVDNIQSTIGAGDAFLAGFVNHIHGRHISNSIDWDGIGVITGCVKSGIASSADFIRIRRSELGFYFGMRKY